MLLLFILLYWGWDGAIRKLLHRKEKALKENKAIKKLKLLNNKGI